MSDQAEHIEQLRHSASHIMAEAVQSLFPDAKFGIGPVIENGFYYDFDLPRPLTPDDLPAIEKLMVKIVSQNVPFTHEEIEARDHRKLIKQLDLVSFHEEAGAGLAYWHPKGGLIRVLIEDYWRKRHLESGYDIVFTPHIGKAQLWETSGHLGFYKDSMYSPMEIDEQDYYIKPMNCPFHIMIYKTKLRSYRELPLRWAELGTVYRYERSGTLHGLLRWRLTSRITTSSP